MKKEKVLLVGDAMIPPALFEEPLPRVLGDYVESYVTGYYESDWSKLQDRRLKVEQQGPEIEVVPEVIESEGKDASMLLGLFVPIFTKVFDAMPNLKIAGVCRAGLENVNVEEATKRGVLVFNVMGRNAEAVSDFAVGLLLAESRNIARAHYSIVNGGWRKEFSNIDFIPQIKGKKVGIAGFGYIGRLFAKKMSGWDCERLVYDPFVDDDIIREAGCIPVDKETLFKESDYISLHLRMCEATRNFVSAKEISLMKKTAVLINTARAGLVDQDALVDALANKRIAGAGIDVFPNEPVRQDNPLLKLDNVTLTTHIAGTTTETLTKSPELLMEDIRRFLKGEEAKFIVNPEVLENEELKKWLEGVRNNA
ncbi:2-hydroxyacid dehydrogenase [Defluviitalea phaphyphila]|uniref:2-hydroxyacid dehydrogenase n=1 Tax=Defluviitalea phaphyphila TaxID=1473580 RepID=UPI000A82ED17|nr:2-hydroxyacid dehydrogenase [Defluviitalea phaphyphila]